MLGINYLFAEAWGSPAITMLQDSVDPSQIGFCISSFMFFNTMAGMIGTAILGQLQIKLDAENNIEVYGNSLFIFMMISYIGCVPFYYLSGVHYSKFMEMIAFEKSAVEAAENEKLGLKVNDSTDEDEIKNVEKL